MLRALPLVLSIAVMPIAGKSASSASPSPTPANDQYLITWKMTAHGHGHSIWPVEKPEWASEATHSAATEGQAVVNFDAKGNRLGGRILRANVSYEIDIKKMPLFTIRCGPLSLFEHDHYSLKTIQPLAGGDWPELMWDPPRKQPDGSWLIKSMSFDFYFDPPPQGPHFATVHLSESWRDRFHFEGGNSQLADVVTSGPLHSVCDSPALPPRLTVESPLTFVYSSFPQLEAIGGFDLPTHPLNVPSTGPVPDVFFKEWKYRVTIRSPAAIVPIEEDIKITVRRLGKCHVSGEIPLNDEPINPNINDEDIEIGVEHGSDSIDPDSGVAALNLRLTCDSVPIKNAKVEVKVEVQKNTGGHTHDPGNRPRGRLKWNGKETRLTDAKPSIPVTTDSDGRAHLTFKPGKAITCGGHPVRTDSDGQCDGFGIAGIYDITASPVRFPARKADVAVEAKVDGLSRLDGDPNYVNDVGAAGHTSGDNATDSTKQQLHAFASAFQDAQVKHNLQLVACVPQVPPWPTIYPLWVIDVSLPFGGQYDFHANWSAPHQTHGRGDGVDFSVHKRNKTATAWPSDSLNLPVCDGYKISPQGWLMMKMWEVGMNYGSWDQSDFKAESQPWHLHVTQ